MAGLHDVDVRTFLQIETVITEGVTPNFQDGRHVNDEGILSKGFRAARQQRLEMRLGGFFRDGGDFDVLETGFF